jgi:frataxin-like iron-binding protein CyaY
MTDTQYHDVSNEYMEFVCRKFEELQDEHGDVDVEYSVCLPASLFGPM